MKNILKSLILSLFLIVFMLGKIANTSAYSSVCEVVILQSNGKILHAQNASITRPMASTTKIITCITVIEYFDLNDIVTIKPEWVGVEGSSIYLRANEQLTVKELLYGLMLRSGNDCALTLACALCGNVENFTVLMNDLAERAGAQNSCFKNPHGLDEEGHFTTAYDLAMITRYAMNNEVFKEIVSTKKVEIGQGDSRRMLYNKNKLLSNYEYATGVKTGYTKKAGRCLVSSANKNGVELICVVLNCGPMFERSKQLLEECFQRIDSGKIIEQNVKQIKKYCKNT